MDSELQGQLSRAGRDRVVVSHAVGASDDGRHALIKVALFGGGTELYALPATLAYWLIDRIAEVMATGAIGDQRATAAAGSPAAQQLALYQAARPDIVDADWELSGRRIVQGIRAHGFGNAVGLMAIADGAEAALVLPDQVAILLHEALTLAAAYLIDRVHAPVSRREH